MQHVIVTGAAGGIGTRLVMDLLELGYSVSALDGDDGRLAALAEQAPAAHRIRVDVTRSADVDRAVAEAVGALGAPHGLVNLVGDNRLSPFAAITDDDWRYLLDANLASAFYVTRAAVPHLRSGGRIVMMSSINGIRGSFHDAAYAAAKAGVVGLTRALATELARERITVNAIAPVVTLTDRVRNIPGLDLSRQLSTIPMGRVGEIEDVTRTISFLLGDGGAFYTGQTFSPNGGDVMP
jgi:NAD(P)-dependent dehydrogenase (short-subunit alcohol dehydrogenase family)